MAGGNDVRFGRRPFLSGTAAALGSWSVPSAFVSFLRGAEPQRARLVLRPVADETTGLPLLQLPEGFRYRSTGWTGDPLADGSPTPGSHDGMAVIAEQEGILTLCRNHEVGGSGKPFGSPMQTYDAKARGGCTNLTFNSLTGEWGAARPSLSGTVKNCAGGPTPWGSWLSCEETLVQDGDMVDDQRIELEHPHGYIFDVPAAGDRSPVPLKAMGRFVHEAVAVDPRTGCVYETEDRSIAGFYRFTPQVPGQLAAGGRLEMMKVAGNPDLIKAAEAKKTYDVSWVPIENPDLAHTPGTTDGGGVITQGLRQGATPFARLEGCWWGDEVCYFVSTSGGRAKAGQIWKYDPRREILQLVFESPGADVLDAPDNITVSPRGGLVLCEDGDRVPQKLQALSPSGVLTELAWGNVQLQGERNKFRGDFRGSEWAGACFSPNGQWLFANLQSPGITFAITGPWELLGL